MTGKAVSTNNGLRRLGSRLDPGRVFSVRKMDVDTTVKAVAARILCIVSSSLVTETRAAVLCRRMTTIR